jgi:hypothetical protein
MILGYVTIDGLAVHTHRDSYLLPNLSVVSVRRPFLAGSLMFVTGFGGFAFSFADLLYAHEIRVIGGSVFVIMATGLWIGQLKLLSRDLRGSELSGVIWGTYGHLNRVRMQIVRAMRGMPEGLR